jgi:hypothetical protein
MTIGKKKTKQLKLSSFHPRYNWDITLWNIMAFFFLFFFFFGQIGLDTYLTLGILKLITLVSIQHKICYMYSLLKKEGWNHKEVQLTYLSWTMTSSNMVLYFKKMDETTKKFNAHMCYEPWLHRTWFYIKKNGWNHKEVQHEYVTWLMQCKVTPSSTLLLLLLP